jgi:hypothetical protein
MNIIDEAHLWKIDDVTLIEFDFFRGNLGHFSDFYNEMHEKLLNDGYHGYFDSTPFSREWWLSIGYFVQFGFAYEALHHIETLENEKLFPRETKRVFKHVKNREKLCAKAREHLIVFMHEIFLKIQSGEMHNMNVMIQRYLDPEVAQIPILKKWIDRYVYLHTSLFIKTFNRAKKGIVNDTRSIISSEDVLKIMSLLKIISEHWAWKRSNKHHSHHHVWRSREIIHELHTHISQLLLDKQQSQDTYRHLSFTHDILLDKYEKSQEESAELKKQNQALESENNALKNSLTEIEKLRRITSLQSALIIHQQHHHDIWGMFQIDDSEFQQHFRHILKKYISDIGDVIWVHLSSTTAHVNIWSGTFAFRVIGTLLNHISTHLDDTHWDGTISIPENLHLPEHGDHSKWGIYEFAQMTKNTPPMWFLEFFYWLWTLHKVGDHDFSTVFETLGKRIKERTPALHREINEYSWKYIQKLQKSSR